MTSPAESSRGRLGATIVALAVGLTSLVSLDLSEQTGAAGACEPSVTIDGLLECPPTHRVRDACGGLHDLRPGDALDTSACVAPTRMPGPQLAALEVAVNVNAASVEELTSLPGVGPVLAERIVRGRPHDGVDALLGVSGIGPVTLAAIRSRVVFGGT